MNELDRTKESLKRSLGELLRLIQTARSVDHQLFREVEVHAGVLASLLKKEELVPKTVLNELHVAARILREEAAFLGSEASEVVRMAERIEIVFDLILRGESVNDRIPGVPRIV